MNNIGFFDTIKETINSIQEAPHENHPFFNTFLFIFYSSLYFSFFLSEKRGIRNKNREIYFPRKESKKKARTIETGVFVINNRIDYSYNYGADERNFSESTIIPVNAKPTRDWLVLVNAHGPADLNLESRFVPGTRTLSWAVPLKNAVNSLTNLSSPHDRLALLKAWSGNKYRKYITFIFVPAGTSMSFKIGQAKEQTGGGEHREGQGIQMRLKDLPQGSIAVTLPVLGNEKQSARLHKGAKKIDIFARFKVAAQMAGLNYRSMAFNYPERDLYAGDYRSHFEAQQGWIKAFLYDFFGYHFKKRR